jgi:hypothetical protein
MCLAVNSGASNPGAPYASRIIRPDPDTSKAAKAISENVNLEDDTFMIFIISIKDIYLN